MNEEQLDNMDTMNEATSQIRTTKAAGGAQSVDRALEILTIVAGRGETGISLTEAVNKTALSRPTIRRLLLALIRSGYVFQSAETKRYHLDKTSPIHISLSHTEREIELMAERHVKELSLSTGDTAFFSVRRGGNAICLLRQEGSYPIRTHLLFAGQRNPLGVGAGSLAMLAALDDAEISDILKNNVGVRAREYPGCTDARLWDEIRRSRETGITMNAGLILDNSWGIARAVFYPDGRIAGALSISAIDSRLASPRREDLARLLIEQTALFEEEVRTIRMDTTADWASPARQDNSLGK